MRDPILFLTFGVFIDFIVLFLTFGCFSYFCQIYSKNNSLKGQMALMEEFISQSSAYSLFL